MTNHQKRMMKKMSDGTPRERKRFLNLMQKKYERKKRISPNFASKVEEAMEKKTPLNIEGVSFDT